MTTTTNVEQVKLNIMTSSQFESATKNADELYMVTDANYSLTAGDGIDITNDVISANIATSVSSSSTNNESVGAKLFYDTCGDIENAINTIRGI